MRVSVKLFIISVLLLCVCIMNSCSGTVGLKNQDKKKIGLIVKMNYGYHWGTVKLGADAAASEFNVNVLYNGPNDEEDVEGQIKLVNSALDDEKVDALILAASDYEALVPVTEKAFKMKIPVIVIDSEVHTDKICSYISIDNVDAGKKAGNMLVQLTGKDNNCNLAIMGFVKGSRNAEQREEGLVNILSQYRGFKIVDRQYCFSDASLAVKLTKKILTENKSIDAIVALNDIASEGVADVVEQMNLSGKVKIIGFGSSSKEVDYLEKGTIQSTIAQNPFSMGYLSVKYAVDVLNGKAIPQFVDTNLKIINKENMYLPENQKLLFPFVK